MTSHCDRWQRDEPDARGSDTRASDTERDEAVQALIRHHVDGRLTTSEFEERTDRALGSRTRGELAAVMSDLPMPGPHAGRPPVSRRFLVVLVGVIALAAIVASRGRAAFGLLWVVAIVSFVRIRGARRSWRASSVPPRPR
jgi:Domain of unknown function (DUF1707)